MFILSSTLLNSFIPDLPDPFSSTIINSHLETALDKSCNPPDLFSILVVEEFYGIR